LLVRLDSKYRKELTRLAPESSRRRHDESILSDFAYSLSPKDSSFIFKKGAMLFSSDFSGTDEENIPMEI